MVEVAVGDGADSGRGRPSAAPGTQVSAAPRPRHFRNEGRRSRRRRRRAGRRRSSAKRSFSVDAGLRVGHGLDGADGWRCSDWPAPPSQRSKPAAMTVTLTSSPISSSMTVPKMMFASWWATPWMISAAAFISNRPMLRRAGDVEQDAAGTVDGGLEQRAADGGLGGGDRTVLAAGLADAHERRAGAGQDHLHVGEVGVDEARRGDQVGDAGDALQQHLVGHLERVEHAGLLVGDGEQAVVRDDDERVDLLLQPLHAGVGLHRTTAALEAERAGDHADGERAHGARDLGDDRARHRCRCRRPRRR